MDPVQPPGPWYVVLNAGSGRTTADERIATLRQVFAAAGRPAEWLPVGRGRDLGAIAADAAERARAADGALLAAGGDGTLNAVAQAAIARDCVFGALPQGTFNYFGRALGIPQDIAAAAQALLRARVAPVQVGAVNGRVFLVNASLGLYQQLLEEREVYKRQLGRSRWVALVAGIPTLLRDHRALDLVVDNGVGQQRLCTPTLFVGNNRLQFEQTGLDAAADAVQHGALAAVAVEAAGRRALLALALRAALGRLGNDGHLVHLPIRRLTVHVRGQRRIKVATDGEITWMQAPLHFEVSPRPLRMLMLRPQDRVNES